MLLDINVLLAFAWPNHQFHQAARQWFGVRRKWHTCAVTQLGFIRLSSNPAFTSEYKTPADAAALLRMMTEDVGHKYLSPHFAPCASATWASVSGHQQVTDAYLLQIADAAGVQFATFDRKLAQQVRWKKFVHVIQT